MAFGRERTCRHWLAISGMLAALTVLQTQVQSKSFTFRAGAVGDSVGDCSGTEQALLGYEYFVSLLNTSAPLYITDSGGSRYRILIDLQTRLDNCNATLHLQQWQDLMQGQGVHLGLGSGYSGFATINAQYMSEQMHRLIFQCCVGPDQIYQLDYKFNFGIQCSNAKYPVQSLRSMAFSNIKRLVILYRNDNTFLRTTCEAAIDLVSTLTDIVPGFQAVSTVSYSTASSQEPGYLEGLVQQAIDIQADAIFACEWSAEGQRIVNAVKAQNYDLKALWLTFGPTTQAFVDNLQDNATYVMSAAQWHPAMTTSDSFFNSAPQFSARFSAAFNGTTATYVSAGAAATGYVYVLAIQQAFATCNLSLTQGDIQQLLFNASAITCQPQVWQDASTISTPQTGYQLLRMALTATSTDTMFGQVHFNSYRRNDRKDPVTTQILNGQIQAVLPLDIADAALVMPIPIRSPSSTDPAAGSAAASEAGSNTTLIVALVVSLGVVAMMSLATVLIIHVKHQKKRSLLGMVLPPKAGCPTTTLLLTDIEDSTRLWESLPSEVMDETLKLHHKTIRSVALLYNGYESRTEGDAFILAFHSACDAAMFAGTAQQELLMVNWPHALYGTQGCMPVWVDPTARMRKTASQQISTSGFSFFSRFVSSQCKDHEAAMPRAQSIEGDFHRGSSAISPQVSHTSGEYPSLDKGMFARRYNQAADSMIQESSPFEFSILCKRPSCVFSSLAANGVPEFYERGRTLSSISISENIEGLCGDSGSTPLVILDTSGLSASSHGPTGQHVFIHFPTIDEEAGNRTFSSTGAGAPTRGVNSKCTVGQHLAQRAPIVFRPTPGSVLIFGGLRVRMGMATGTTDADDVEFNAALGRVNYGGPLMTAAKQISEAAAGGMVLMSAATFKQLPLERMQPQIMVMLMGDHKLGEGRPPVPVYQLSPQALRHRAAHLSPVRSLSHASMSYLQAPYGHATVCFMNVVGLASLQAWDTAVTASALQTYQRIAQATLGEHGGYLVEAMDGLCLAAFSLGPARATRWALATIARCLEAEWPEALLQHELGEVVSVTSYLPCALSQPPSASHSDHDKEKKAINPTEKRNRRGSVCKASRSLSLVAVEKILLRGLRVKVGLDYGPVLSSLHATSARMTYSGRVMNRSARISSASKSGQVWTTHAVWEMAKLDMLVGTAVGEDPVDELHPDHSQLAAMDLGSFKLKGITEEQGLVHCFFADHMVHHAMRHPVNMSHSPSGTLLIAQSELLAQGLAQPMEVVLSQLPLLSPEELQQLVCQLGKDYPHLTVAIAAAEVKKKKTVRHADDG